MARRIRFRAFAQFSRSFKSRIETASGLSLTDLLNVALFTLTIASLLLAASGVAVAWITYKDAQVSGEKQEAALNSAAQSLATARQSLESTEKRLAEMDDALKQNITIAKDEQKNLSASVALSKVQLSTLQKQVEIASRAPDVVLFVFCSARSFKNPLADTVPFLIENGVALPVDPVTLREKRGPSEGKLHIDQDDLVTCACALKNRGKMPLTNAYIRAAFAPHVDKYGVSDTSEDSSQSRINFAPDPGGKSVVIQEGKKIFPSPNSWEGFNTTANLLLGWHNPPTFLVLRFEYGGNEQPRDSGEIHLVLDRSDSNPK